MKGNTSLDASLAYASREAQALFGIDIDHERAGLNIIGQHGRTQAQCSQGISTCERDSSSRRILADLVV